ncbi:MAG: DegT/DnrJ/EryC1/StrS family aminotransferase [Micrococcales bacterium]|nr:DegT/DnrJ/EryC1/StrS family aminotransferase [Micrococcales bacterium]
MIPAAKPLVGRAERKAVARVMKSGGLAQGPEVAAFEKEFAQLVNGLECVAVNSGTSALHLAFLAADIGPGDEVIVPSFSFAATANAVRLAGATPVFGDIDVQTFNLCPKHAATLITPRTRAIMPVHLYGHPADMVAFDALAKQHGLMLFEDAAQAVGASLHGTPVGCFSTAASFSFYPTKNMTSGEGGMVTTPSSVVARSVRILRNQGMEKKYQNEVVGFNTRMTDIHAAIGRVQLTKLGKWTARRQQNAEFLNSHLQNVVVPPVMPGAVHVWHQYTIQLSDLNRDRFAEELSKKGVGSGVYYPTPIHRLPSFQLSLDLTNTEKVASSCLSLPVHPALRRRDLERIVESVNSIAATGA